MVGLALYADLGASEVLGLEWRDVDLETGSLKIHQTAHDGELRDTTKSYKVRTVPISPSLNSILRDLKSECEEREQATGLLFSRDGVHPYHQVHNIFGRIKRQARQESDGGFHALRHTFATRLANKGAPIPRLQKLLGVSSYPGRFGGLPQAATDLDSQAFTETGLFGNQNSVCKPTTTKWSHTVERLKQVWEIVIDG